MPALLQEDDRRFGQRRQFRLGGGATFADVGDMRVGLAAPLAPRRQLGGDGASPRRARLRFARQILRCRLGLGEFGAFLRRGGARPFERQRQLVARRQRTERRFVLRLAFGRFALLRLGAGQRLVERRQPRQRLGAAPLGRREFVARRIDGGARRPRCLARRAFGVGRVAQPRLGLARRGAGDLRRLARRLGLALEIAEPVLFGQPLRRRRRRVGGDDVAVPAPQVAVERDQPLAGLQQRREARAVGAGHDADLRQPPPQRRRRFDAPGQRLDAIGQRRVAFGFVERPMRRRIGVDRGAQIFAERRAERRLIAARDVDRVERRPPFAARRGAEQPGQRIDFRVESLRRALGLGERPARAPFRVARFGVRRLGGERLSFCLGERLGERLDRLGLGALRRLLAAKPRGAGRARAPPQRIRSRSARGGATLQQGRRRSHCGARCGRKPPPAPRRAPPRQR